MVNLLPNRFGSFEYKNNTFKVEVPVGHTTEDFLKEEYWSHVARNLRNGDIIFAMAEDNSFFIQAVVIAAWNTGAKVHIFQYATLSKDFELPAEADKNYEVAHGGNHHKWRVLRKSDAKVLVAKLATREDAIKWLNEYKKALVERKAPPAYSE